MAKVVSITDNVSGHADPKRGFQKPLEEFLWEHCSIFFIEDERFFTRETIDLAKDLYEVVAQEKDLVHNKYRDYEIVLRLTERRTKIEHHIHEDLKKMSNEDFSEYREKLLDILVKHEDVDLAKKSVYSERLQSIASDVSGNEDNQYNLVEMSHGIVSFSHRLESIHLSELKDAIKNSRHMSLDLFTDEFDQKTIVHDVIEDMVNRSVDD